MGVKPNTDLVITKETDGEVKTTSAFNLIASSQSSLRPIITDIDRLTVILVSFCNLVQQELYSPDSALKRSTTLKFHKFEQI